MRNASLLVRIRYSNLRYSKWRRVEAHVNTSATIYLPIPSGYFCKSMPYQIRKISLNERINVYPVLAKSVKYFIILRLNTRSASVQLWTELLNGRPNVNSNSSPCFTPIHAPHGLLLDTCKIGKIFHTHFMQQKIQINYLHG